MAASPSLADPSSLLPVPSVAILRVLLGGRQPTDQTLLLLRENTPLKHAPKLWESVSDRESGWKWVNPEVIVGKGEAFALVESRLLILLNARDKLNGDISALDGQIKELFPEEDDDQEAPVPEDYTPWRLKGPQVYADHKKIGRVNWRSRREDVLRRSADLACVPELAEAEHYWQVEMVWEREQAARRSLKKFNAEYLKVKKDCLKSMRDAINIGVTNLVDKFMRSFSNLGATSIDLAGLFRDRDVNITLPKDYVEAFNLVESVEPLLKYGGERNESGTHGEHCPGRHRRHRSA